MVYRQKYPKGCVEIEEDSVTIRDTYGREMVHWTTQEFEEDPTSAIAACNAIHICYTEGVEALATRLKQKIGDPNFLHYRDIHGDWHRMGTEGLL